MRHFVEIFKHCGRLCGLPYYGKLVGKYYALKHYLKSQIFVQKFYFDKTPTFSRVFQPNFFDNFFREIKVVNS